VPSSPALGSLLTLRRALSCWTGPGLLCAPAWGEVQLQVASAKTRRRSTRKRTPEEPQRDGLPWPMLREQQALQARWGAAEQAAAAKRAQVLVSQGYGPLIE